MAKRFALARAAASPVPPGTRGTGLGCESGTRWCGSVGLGSGNTVSWSAVSVFMIVAWSPRNPVLNATSVEIDHGAVIPARERSSSIWARVMPIPHR